MIYTKIWHMELFMFNQHSSEMVHTMESSIRYIRKPRNDTKLPRFNFGVSLVILRAYIDKWMTS